MAVKDKLFELFSKEARYNERWEKYLIVSNGWELVSDDTADLFEQFKKQEKLGHTKYKLSRTKAPAEEEEE